MNRFELILLLVLTWLPLPASALQIFACEPEWASLAAELGGERVTTYSAVTGRQDAHVMQAKPSLIARFRKADLVICTGASLESGWLPVLFRQGGNPAVQPGKPGFLEAASYVPLLDKPVSLDRAQGELHPMGNPHIQLDPRNIGRVATALTERLVELDPSGADEYTARGQDFQTRWVAATRAWDTRGAPLRGMAVITQHRGWTYLEDWLGLDEVATLEPKPGIEPSTSHLASLLSTAKSTDVRVIVRSSYQSPRASEWLSSRTGIPAEVLPNTVGSVDGVDNLFDMFDVILNRLEAVRQ
jgi:zinc/manganese transport system substrate-binding protein